MPLLLNKDNKFAHSLIHKEVKLNKNIIVKKQASYYSKSFKSDTLVLNSQCPSSSCDYIEVVLTPSKYKIELWGSQGGKTSYSNSPGAGSYASAYYKPKSKVTLYIYLGNSYGFNGGGEGGSGVNEGGNGGGATDIRIGGMSLDNRIMVAGGGGGAGGICNCGKPDIRSYCSSSLGGNGDCDGPSQDSKYGQPGLKGTLSNGGSGGTGGVLSSSTNTDGIYYPASGGGGGGGYYGGGGGGSGYVSGYANNTDYNQAGYSGNAGSKGNGGAGGRAAFLKAIYAFYAYPGGSGGGGSSYINTNILEKIEIKEGNVEMKNTAGTTQIGNRANGAIRITDYKIYPHSLPPHLKKQVRKSKVREP